MKYFNRFSVSCTFWVGLDLNSIHVIKALKRLNPSNCYLQLYLLLLMLLYNTNKKNWTSALSKKITLRWRQPRLRLISTHFTCHQRQRVQVASDLSVSSVSVLRCAWILTTWVGAQAVSKWPVEFKCSVSGVFSWYFLIIWASM